MRSNYKRLGNYIQPVEKRNKELLDIPLMGLSINKVFIPSIANTIGTNMASYRVIKRNQFAYGPVTSRNGNKITIALFDDFEEALISQAYIPFEITDFEKLHPEYLMMWFRRPEFDRYARFKSHGSAREIFSWEDMCEVELPVPPIEKQREIVAEYNAVQKRIDLNKQLIQKLEESAQAIYKHWFVDFEFPNEKGKAYKSSGGEMVWCEELGKDVPEGWRNCHLRDITNCFDFKRKPLSVLERNEFQGVFPYYGAMGIVDYVREYIFDGEYLLFSEDGVNVIDEKGHPSVFLVWGKFWVNNHAHILQGKEGYSTRLIYMMLKEINVSDIVTGAAQPKINQENMKMIKIPRPNIKVVSLFKHIIDPLFETKKHKIEEIKILEKAKEILLSKMTNAENEKEVV